MVPPGIEPGTQGFSVLCSTNWAMAPSCLQSFPNCECKGRCFFWTVQLFWKEFYIFSPFFIYNLLRFTFSLYLCSAKWSESSAVGSVLRSGRRGREFESPLSDTICNMAWIFLHAIFFFTAPVVITEQQKQKHWESKLVYTAHLSLNYGKLFQFWNFFTLLSFLFLYEPTKRSNFAHYILYARAHARAYERKIIHKNKE